MKTNVLSKPQESRDRLSELGLDAAVFTQAIQRGQAIAAEYTPNHPAICRGNAKKVGKELLLRERNSC